MLCFRKSPVAKMFMDKRGASRFSIGNFLSHSTENYRRGLVSSFINFGYRKNVDKSGGEYQDFPSKMFCLRVPKIFVWETLCAVFQNFSSSEKFRIRGGGDYQDFPSKTFCLKVPKSFVGGLFFSISLVSGFEKTCMQGRGSIKIFSRKFFCLTVPKYSVGESFSVSLVSGVEKV